MSEDEKIDPRDLNVHTDAQKAKVLEWLGQKWNTAKICEICGTNDWQIQPHTVTPVILAGKDLSLGPDIASYPQVMVICSNCGNTKYFSAIKIGIMDSEDMVDANGK